MLACTLCTIYVSAQTQYQLRIRGVDKDSATIVSQTGIRTSFSSRPALADYVSKLPGYLQSKGYVTASIDSIKYDSLFTTVSLYTGTQYRWTHLDVNRIEPQLLDAVGWREKLFSGKSLDFKQVQTWQERILSHLENTGYPFALVYLDSLRFNVDPGGDPADPAQVVSAMLKVNKGPQYKIDSIRIYGNAKITNSFLHRYLELPPGTIYNKGKLLQVNKKLSELLYIEEEKPADLSLLGTGSVLNVYLRQKKNSQVNFIIGFLPNNNQLVSQKMLITGEGNLLLRNAFGSGETIGFNFQKLQVESQRLNLLYQHPYLFNTPIGLDFYFDFLQKDSSFVNINMQVGGRYILNSNEAGKVFIQKNQTIVNQGAINSGFIIQNRRLPDVADVSSFNIGLDYEYNRTDYRLNPRSGTEINLLTSIGTKKIKKNNEVLSLKDPSDPGFNFNSLYDTVKLKTYQLLIRGTAAKYFPLGKQRSTIKTALNAGMFQSANIFRNELFQVGGYKLLRGFDEESQYLSSFVIGTVEYRYLVGQNSFFYVLADGGWGQNNRQELKLNYTYFSTGLGLAFEMKAGIFNLAWAVGKRNDTPLSLRQSKIHFGFVNYF